MGSGVRWVALDAMGVLYVEAGVATRLCAFAARRGVVVAEEAVRAAYRRVSAGEGTSADLWRELGVPGDPDELDRAWAGLRSLMPGAGAFLAAAAEAGIGVGCITNDVAVWSRRSRAALGLEGVAPWIVSAEVACRKPGRAIYDAFLSAVGCAPDACLFVDDQPQNLDAAARLGFRTAWFAAGYSVGGVGNRYGRVGSFEELAATMPPLVTVKGA
ncbi:MAG TPA: HAD-IA family hydrolase [Actinomycetota bacterium]|nr:HAD-IA family hydrolase [Actinomycetota bacterium]